MYVNFKYMSNFYHTIVCGHNLDILKRWSLSCKERGNFSVSGTLRISATVQFMFR